MWKPVIVIFRWLNWFDSINQRKIELVVSDNLIGVAPTIDDLHIESSAVRGFFFFFFLENNLKRCIFYKVQIEYVCFSCQWC